ncbi:MAG: type I glutamate--ammonia ligase [Bacillota bacterium]|nr:type I glutamate--ammonia ligase [Bacillota bacterium]
MFTKVEDVQKYCLENGVKMIDFKMIDLNGRWRHLSLPVERFNESVMQWGLGFDGSNYGFAPVEKSDMVFIPDLTSACMEPFTEMPTLTMIGDVCTITPNGNIPFDQYPRNVAKAAVEYMRSTGIADEIILGPEFEFHIFNNISFEAKPQRVAFEVDSIQAEWYTSERSHGYQTQHKGGYHIAPPQDMTYDLRSKMCVLLEERGVEIKYHHHEVGGPAQVEIELNFAPLVEMADRTMMLKYVVKNAAIKEGLSATFMPKPIHDEAGNGMHVHMMLRKDGKPVFYDQDGYSGLSETAHYFIGGILKHAASLCALTNPSTNSYRRLVPGYEAPVTIGYATANRSAVIRIPAYAKDPMEKRFELRSIDATCNPYFAYAAILMAGLDGVENKIDPRVEGWGPYDFNLYNLSEEDKKKIQGLPPTFRKALRALDEDHDYLLKGGVFSERLLKIWYQRKLAEADTIESYPHPAEYKYYYDL